MVSLSAVGELAPGVYAQGAAADPALTSSVGVPIGAAVPAPATASTSAWTTYKGDAQRTSSSEARLNLPLNLMWRHTSDAAPVVTSGSPLVVGPQGLRRVYFAAGTAVYCIDAQNGTQLWKSTLGGTLRAPLSILTGETGDLVLATTTGGQMTALRSSDGGTVWTAETRSPVQGASPVLAKTANGERILAAIATGRVIAFTRDGKIDPDFEVRLGRVGSTPTSTPILTPKGDKLIVTAQDRNMYAVNLADASVAWTTPLRATAYTSPTISGNLILTALENSLVGLYESDGEVKWRADLAGRALGSPATRAGVAYIGTVRGSLFAIDVTEGTTLWKADLQGSISGTPLVLPNVVIVGTRNGVLHGLNPQDGKVIWRYRMHTERAMAVAA
ncbi:MAG TPA: PQQ-binding-like beta-propeller repeat protein, partial [Abditibacteriaceae bacterium]